MANKEPRKWRWWRLLLGFCFALLFLAVAWQQRRLSLISVNSPPPAAVSSPVIVTPPALVPLPPTVITAPLPISSLPPWPDEPAEVQADAAGAQLPLDLKLIIPVANIKAAQLRDTYADARSEGRVHNAIDIMAPQGTPVLAAADGKIARLFDSEKGGITLYQMSNDQRVVFYYAHLQRYADGMEAGRAVRQGETIAYVGDTGNAGPGNFHLHFAIWLVTDPKRYWDGLNVNPYPMLKEAR